VRVTLHIYYASRRPDLDESLILDLLQDVVYIKGGGGRVSNQREGLCGNAPCRTEALHGQLLRCRRVVYSISGVKMNDLLKLNVNDHVEKKNGLSYLSWAWAWAEALKADPAATFHVESYDVDGKTQCYMDVNGTAMVWVRVTLFGKPMTCMLPVMNSKNEPIPIEGRTFKDKYGKDKVEKVDAFNVNTAIMRCMTKALALHGLGLYIYAGEDLPEDHQPETKPEPPKAEKKVEEKTTKAPKTDADIELFAKSVIEYVVLAKTQSGLKSYWVANQTQLDELKAANPALYATVVESFKAAKATLGE